MDSFTKVLTGFCLGCVAMLLWHFAQEGTRDRNAHAAAARQQGNMVIVVGYEPGLAPEAARLTTGGVSSPHEIEQGRWSGWGVASYRSPARAQAAALAAVRALDHEMDAAAKEEAP